MKYGLSERTSLNFIFPLSQLSAQCQVSKLIFFCFVCQVLASKFDANTYLCAQCLCQTAALTALCSQRFSRNSEQVPLCAQGLHQIQSKLALCAQCIGKAMYFSSRDANEYEIITKLNLTHTYMHRHTYLYVAKNEHSR